MNINSLWVADFVSDIIRVLVDRFVMTVESKCTRLTMLRFSKDRLLHLNKI